MDSFDSSKRSLYERVNSFMQNPHAQSNQTGNQKKDKRENPAAVF